MDAGGVVVAVVPALGVVAVGAAVVAVTYGMHAIFADPPAYP
jgi:hypothetical protein